MLPLVQISHYMKGKKDKTTVKDLYPAYDVLGWLCI